MATAAFQAGQKTDDAVRPVAPAPPSSSAPPVRRLLVLVPPDTGLDADLAGHAWRLAAPQRLPVVLIGLAQDGATEAQRRRQLASLAALTGGEGVPVTVSLAAEAQWLPAVRRLWRPGDLVLCFAGQVAPAGWLGLGRQPLGQALRTALAVSLHEAELDDAVPARPRPGALAQALSLLAALLIVAGFFWVQVLVVRAADGLSETVLLLLLGALEFGTIYVHRLR